MGDENGRRPLSDEHGRRPTDDEHGVRGNLARRCRRGRAPVFGSFEEFGGLWHGDACAGERLFGGSLGVFVACFVCILGG